MDTHLYLKTNIFGSKGLTVSSHCCQAPISTLQRVDTFSQVRGRGVQKASVLWRWPLLGMGRAQVAMPDQAIPL